MNLVNLVNPAQHYDLSPTVAPAVAAGHPLLDGSKAAAARFAGEVAEVLGDRAAAAGRLWDYYANPCDAEGRQAQQAGLPPRVVGGEGGGLAKEVSVENDIGWRVDAGVDFLFGRPIVLDSAAPDAGRAGEVGELLRRILAANGGLGFLQKLALTAAVAGRADVLVKLLADNDDVHAANACDTAQLGGGAAADDATTRLARRVRLEIVDPARSLPILDPLDADRLCAYAQVARLPTHEAAPPADDWVGRLFARREPPHATLVEVIGSRGWQTYRDGRLVARGPNPLGRLPLVTARNGVGSLGGAGEVAPLIPLQDRLNTHLCDRAGRLALQSQPMYLGVGIEGFLENPVAPGRMWATDNPDARVEVFAAEGHSPSELEAIREVREAMDKISGVNPTASGAIRGRVGNLTSAAALRLTFQSLLARTERKRANFAAAIADLCEVSLALLDAAGLFGTTDDERRVGLTWPDPIPVDAAGELEQARLKQQIGIDPDVVRRELGY